MDRAKSVLICPSCRAPLGAALRGKNACENCGKTFHARPDQIVFTRFSYEETQRDWLNSLKERAKRRMGRFYPTLCKIIAPVHATGHLKPFLASFDPERQLVADLGCGTTHYRESVLCVDGVDYPNVHLVADLEHLPLQNESLDGIISVAVLEHAQDPHAHVAEMRRVLRPGGRVLCFIPFIQGFHASLHDYQRYTAYGLRELFREFEILNVSVGAGPTSGMLWILQEWLALVLSFGSVRLYRLLLPCMWILSPLKYLDVLLAKHPEATIIASGHFIEARKSAVEA
jgi:SAM-dependent methyltransferase